MKRYIGTKYVRATPMNRLEYNNYRGWELPSDENGEDEGYLVEYVVGSKPNHAKHRGYISWSPKEQFDDAYQEFEEGMSFGHAIGVLKLGLKVARKGWNGKGMWLVLANGTKKARVTMNEGSDYQAAGLTSAVIDPHIDMHTAQGTMQPGWLASQADMLADDWVVVK